MSEQLLRQLGIEQQILQQLVDEQAMVAEARRQGISVSDVEIRERILAIPAFQENGQFIGEARYRQMLQFNNPPMTTTEFEDNLRRAVARRKAAQRGDRLDVGQRRRGRRGISPPQRKGQARRRAADARRVSQPGDRDRRRCRRALREEQGNLSHRREAQDSATRWSTSIRSGSRSTVPEADIEAFYKQNQAQYSTPEQIRASHILLKTEGKDEAAVRTQAEEVLKRVKAGEDFAALAKQYLGRRQQQHQGRGSRLLRPRHDGAGIRAGGVRDEGRRDQRPRQDVVRLPHHQARRSSCRRRRGRWPRCAPRSKIS